MRFRFVLMLCASQLGLAPLTAAALTVKNLDPEDRKITVTENDKKTERTLKPSEVMTDACAAACEIETVDGDVYDFDGNEFVTIEEGLLFIGDADSQPTNAAPEPPQSSR
ncbi:MAG: hypothetical protein SGJ17_06010 [Hyphomicrobiales bacterium]|nr:hypothetical protein [Hyphomicrobiales bacterium]